MAFEQEAEQPKCGRAKRKTNCWRAIVAQNFQQAFKFLFGCWHRKLSRPFTLAGRTYEVCLGCGKEFAYVRVDFGRSFPKRKEEGDKLDKQDVVGADEDRRRDLDRTVNQRARYESSAPCPVSAGLPVAQQFSPSLLTRICGRPRALFKTRVKTQ